MWWQQAPKKYCVYSVRIDNAEMMWWISLYVEIGGDARWRGKREEQKHWLTRFYHRYIIVFQDSLRINTHPLLGRQIKCTQRL